MTRVCPPSRAEVLRARVERLSHISPECSQALQDAADRYEQSSRKEDVCAQRRSGLPSGCGVQRPHLLH